MIKPHLKLVKLGRFRTSRWICTLSGVKFKGYGNNPIEAYNHFMSKLNYKS